MSQLYLLLDFYEETKAQGCTAHDDMTFITISKIKLNYTYPQGQQTNPHPHWKIMSLHLLLQVCAT
jgi:hypothetical protein